MEKRQTTLEQPFPMDNQSTCCHHHHEPSTHHETMKLGTSIQIFLIVFALSMALFHPRTDTFTTFSIIFSSIVLEAIPFMLFGTMLGGIIEVFVSRETLINTLPKSRKRSIIFAGLLGLIFPVCECAIVPVVRKLLDKGMPLGSAVTFLLAGPIVNPLVFASTLVAYSFSWDIAILRIFAGFGIAIGVGILVDDLFSIQEAVIEKQPTATCGCGHSHDHPVSGSLPSRLRAALSHGAADFYDICKFLVIGAFIAAALQTLIPRQSFIDIMSNPFVAIFSMMTLAVTLNLCSEADAFISASFQPMGIPLSAQLSFMVLGPMLDIKLILMYLSVFSKKMIITLTTLVIFMVGLSMIFVELSQWFL